MAEYYAVGTARAVVLEAAAEGSAPALVVEGTAVDYDRVGYFSPKDRVAIKPGAAAKALKARAESANRDVLALVAHDPSRVVGRTANGTLSFKDSKEGLQYRLELDAADPEAASVHAKVANGNMSAASIGFAVTASEEATMADNSPDAPEAGADVNVEYATAIDVFEVSLVAHGAYGGATALAASALFEGQHGTVAADEGEHSPAEGEAEAGATAPDEGGDGTTWREAAAEWERAGILTTTDIARLTSNA